MFLGTHTPRLDEKGRLFLPAKYREELAGGLVITKGQERCLYVFPVAEFGRIADGPARRPSPRKRYGITAGCSSPVPRTRPLTSRAGSRFRPRLREYAALTRDCTVIGANTRLEIWDSAAWESYLAEQEDAFSAASEEGLPGVL